MVAIVNTGRSISRALNYNEHKVGEGKATCIAIRGCPMDVEEMNFYHKLNLLQRRAALNENVQRHCVHISLNFDPSEKFNVEKLTMIAEDYMQRIGFGDQPYLIYEHSDAGHPHMHIVSVKIRADGSRIDTQNIGRNQSRAACEAMEAKYGLIKAKGRNTKKFNPAIDRARIVQYGTSETRRQIANVLGHVLDSYHYGSLPELNAVLRGYNVMASRGSEDSRIFKNNGLIYQVLDDDGKPVGKPIKASAFHNNPGWGFLQNKFQAVGRDKQQEKAQVRVAINGFFRNSETLSLHALMETLKRKGIATILRQNANGLIYGITFVDHNTKCVFNGSALGKEYSAAAIQNRCIAAEQSQGKGILQEGKALSNDPISYEQATEPGVESGLAKTIGLLTEPTSQNDFVDPNLKKKKRNTPKL